MQQEFLHRSLYVLIYSQRTCACALWGYSFPDFLKVGTGLLSQSDSMITKIFFSLNNSVIQVTEFCAFVAVGGNAETAATRHFPLQAIGVYVFFLGA